MIEMTYIIHDDKSLLNIVFNREVLENMRAKVDDNVYFFQSAHNPRLCTILKTDTGYRITRVPRRRKTYQINLRHRLDGLDEFDTLQCTYFVKKNGLIRVKIPDANISISQRISSRLAEI